MDISRVRQGIADAAASVAGLRCFGYVPDSITPPVFYAGEVEIDPEQTFGPMDKVQITCRVLVSRSDDRTGQKLLDGFLKRTGPTSIRAALAAARGAPGQAALGGVCDDMHVRRIQGYRLYRIGETAYFGAEIIVEAIGDGD